MDAETLSQHAAFVRRLAWMLTRDEDEADDVSQQTMLRALESPPRQDGSMRGWLAQVARNVVRQSRRAKRRRQDRELRAAREDIHSATPDDEAARRELVLFVIQAVLELDEPYQTAIFDRIYHDLEPKEIAARRGVPVATVKSQLKRARSRLRASLDRRSKGDRRQWTALLLSWLDVPQTLQFPLETTSSWAGASKLASIGAGILVIAAGSLLYFSRSPAVDTEARASSNAALAQVESRLASRSEPSLDSGVATSDLQPVGSKEDEVPPRLFGRIVDPRGEGIAGARLIAFPPGLVTIEISEPGRFRAGVSEHRTDEAGRFEIPIGDRPSNLDLYVEAAGFAPEIFEGQPAEERTFVLSPGFSIVGRVSSRDREPAANLVVTWSGAISGSTRIERSAETDIEGRFRITDLPDLFALRESRLLPSGKIRVERAGLPLVWQAVAAREPSPSRETTVDLFIPRSGTIEGTVRGPAGEVLPAAEVVAFSSAADHRPSFLRTRTDDQGRFRLEGLPPGQTPVFAWTSGLGPGVTRPELPEGGALEIEIPCPRERRIQGRVVDPDGRPVPGASVSASLEQMPKEVEDAPRPAATTDAEGHFLLEGIGLPPGRTVRLTAKDLSRGLRGSAEVLLAEDALTDSIDLVVREVVHARIRVVDLAGEPVFGAMVTPLEGGTTPGWTDRRGEVRYRSDWTDESLPPVRVTVIANGFALTESEVFIPSREAPPLIWVRLAPEHRIAGTVLQADGAPAPHCRVTAEETTDPEHPLFHGRDLHGAYDNLEADPRSPSALTDAAGRFELRHVPPGTYRLRARGLLDEQATAEEVRPDSREIRITLGAPPASEPTPTADFEVLVVDGRDGAPIIHSKAFLLAGDRPARAGRATTDGAFVFEDRPFSPIDLEATAPGYASRRLDHIEPLDGGRVRRVRLPLQPGVSVPVRLLPKGGGLETRYWELHARSVDGATRSRVEVGPNGEASLEDLVPGGRYRLEILEKRGFEPGGVGIFSPAWWLPISDQPRIAPAVDGGTRWDIEIEPACELSLSVRPFERVKALSLVDSNGRDRFAIDDPGPERRAPKRIRQLLPRGSYRIQVTLDDESVVIRDVVLTGVRHSENIDVD